MRLTIEIPDTMSDYLSISICGVSDKQPIIVLSLEEAISIESSQSFLTPMSKDKNAVLVVREEQSLLSRKVIGVWESTKKEK